MERELESLEPIGGARRPRRATLGIRGELTLAIAPTLVVLLVFGLVEVLTEQRLLFASLAGSAFLIYLDPEHGTNTVRTLTISQLMAAGLGLLAYLAIPPDYLSGGLAMVATIVLMITLDVVHPPAVSTSLAFAFRAGEASNFTLFALAVGITALLVLLQRSALWQLVRLRKRRPK
jgi:CBS-domain-containing membrane protein